MGGTCRTGRVIRTVRASRQGRGAACADPASGDKSDGAGARVIWMSSRLKSGDGLGS